MADGLRLAPRWLRHAFGLVVAIPAILVGGATFVAPASPAWAAPFGCTNDLYYGSGQAISVRKPDGTVQSVSTAPFAPFAIAISPSGVLYAFSGVPATRNHLFTIADNGTVTDLGVVAGLTTTTNVGGAGFTAGGDLLVFQDAGRLFRIDVGAGALTATQVTTANTYTPGDLITFGGEVYGSGPNGASLARFNLTTGAVTQVPISNATGVGYPALWSIGGHIYAVAALQSTLYEIIIDPQTDTARRVTIGPISTGVGDGASCLTAPSPLLNAADDDFSSTPVRVVAGGTAGNVFTNDTRNGVAVTQSNVTATITANGGVTGAAIAADGSLTIPAGTAAGTYTLTYRLCRTDNVDICDPAEVKVVVARDAIVATDDSFDENGGNVFGNDTIEGNPVAAADVTVTLTNNGGLTGATLGANGTLTVPGNAAPGTYTLTYEICQVGDPTNCDTANITVTVPSDDIVAGDDSFDENGGNVFGNDTIEGNPVAAADVTATLTNDGGLTGATLARRHAHRAR